LAIVIDLKVAKRSYIMEQPTVMRQYYDFMEQDLLDLEMHLDWYKRSVSSVSFLVKELTALIDGDTDPKYLELIEKAQSALRKAHDTILEDADTDSNIY